MRTTIHIRKGKLKINNDDDKNNNKIHVLYELSTYKDYMHFP